MPRRGRQCRARLGSPASGRETNVAQAHQSGRITTDVDGGILLIGIDRVAKRNAFGLAMLDELAAAYDQLNDSRDLRVGVLHAHGAHFSAGLDLAEVGPVVATEGPQRLAGGGNVDPFGVWKPPVTKPVVMAVQGIAYTLSIELALAADMVVAADDARFRQLEVGRGIMPYGVAKFSCARSPELERDALPANCRGVWGQRGAAHRPSCRRW